MSILNELNGESEQSTDLAIFNPVKETGPVIPMSAIKTRAAETAFLASSPDKALENYQLMVAEGEGGSDAITQTLIKNVKEENKQRDMKTIMGVLSDPTISYDRKKSVVDSFKNNQQINEPSIQLSTAALSAPSADETPDNETARLTAADTITGMYEARKQLQGLVNAHMSDKDWKNASSIADTAVSWLAPFGTSIIAAKITEDQRQKGESVWGTVKSFLAPGTSFQEKRAKLASIPLSEREAYTKSLLSSISKKSGIILSSENQFNQLQLAEQIFNEDGYSNVDKWIDNLSVVLDVVGLGSFIRGGKTVAKASKPIDGMPVPPVPTEAVVAPSKGLPEPSVATESIFTLRPKKFDAVQGEVAQFQQNIIDKLEKEKSDLLGEAGNVADKGAVRGMNEELAVLRSKLTPSSPDSVKAKAKELQSVEKLSYKEATKEAEKRITDANSDVSMSIARLEQQIENNKKASTATQRIAAIEKDLEQIKAARVDSPGKLTPIADLVRRIEVRSVTHTYNPASPAAIMQQTNPEKARALFEAVFKSDGDEVAAGLYGATRIEALAGDVFPQAVTESGHVLSKPVDIQRNMNVPQEIIEGATPTGGLQFTQNELSKAVQSKANKFNDFASAGGLHLMDNMGSFSLDGTVFKIGGTYGTPNGAFSNAQQAYDQALLSFRNQGVLPEEITILSKSGLDHIPVKLEDVAGIEGNYLVRVETKSEIDPTDISSWERFDVKRNWLDRIPMFARDGYGSAARMIMDAASMLHPVYTSAASVANDQAANFEKLLLGFATRFSDKYSQLRTAEKAAVDSYIREANAKGIKFDTTDLTARGFSAEMISSLKSWREYWDGNYYLENLDAVRTMTSNGFERLVTANADVLVRPLKSYQNVKTVYDPMTDMVVNISDVALKQLYDNNGNVGKLARPTKFGNDMAEYVVVRNTPTEYTRKLRDTDTVLNYRDGYYQVKYKAPRFVDEIDANGIRRAVAVAGDTHEAEVFANGMRNSNPNNLYEVRADDRAMRTGSDDWFDVNSASGRIAQRHRGKLLEDATGLNLLGDGSYVVNPVDSAISAARSIAGRTITRPVVEASKARMLSQYEHLMPSDGMGGVRFPRDSSEIGDKGKQHTSEVADARTTFEYIKYLENGYLNSMDNAFKAGFHVVADMLGKVGASKLERGALIASEVSPSSVGKGSVFMAYLGTFPLRQLVVQAHQGVRTFAYNPIGWATGSVEKHMGQYLGDLATNKVSDFTRFVEDSGIMAAVDKQNLVRGTLLEAANASHPITKAVMAVPNTTRQLGFDTGERANNLIHMAAVYDKFKRKGKNLSDKYVRDQAAAEARALSYEMNFAGDMPYNQNSLSLWLQFMQVPHKAFLQATNRKLDRATRRNLFVVDTVLWGVPGITAISALVGGDILPDNPADREFVQYGLESVMTNSAFRTMFEDESINIDFSSLAPHDVSGFTEFFYSMWTGGPSQVLMNSPTGQLFFKEDGRVRTAINSAARFFGMQEDIDETPQEFLSVVKDVLSISSGWSAGAKAYAALETQKSYDKYDRLIDNKTHPVEAYLQAFGFGSANQRDMFAASKAAAESVKSHKEEVLSVYKSVVGYYAKELQGSNVDIKHITKVSSFALRKYKDDPVAQQIIWNQLSLDLQDKDTQLMSLIMKAINLPTSTTMRDSIRNMPDSPNKQKLMERIDDIERLRN